LDELVTIEIFGRPFTFKAESEVSKAKEVAEFLKNELKRAQSQHSGTSSEASKIAILTLAALNIANENLELKTDRSDFLQDISDRSMGLIRTLDAGLQ
jgi:cell division protein ZapA (FtsZ GTPase activity inhibitor)